MADLIRPAKSGNNWTFYDLESYHISLNPVDPLQFFGLKELPHPSVDQELLDNLEAAAMQEDRHAELINLHNLTKIPDDDETAVTDFTVKLFDVLGYTRRDRVARTQMNLDLFVCGETKPTKTDVCVVDFPWNQVILLVQADRRLENASATKPYAQLVAKAVAAFDRNNQFRRWGTGLPRLTETIIPGIVMVGTSPVFFKIPVTETLWTHIRHGSYPPEETRVIYCYPPVPHPPCSWSEGMMPLENRREILECFEAFKALVGI
ncbi:hypothetical protein BJ322DRAFT_1034560 [Thelephora terrestris]|uniref:Uncharacterized protein n=1 Tax=Thelephora terrestris TaxID=56493 RepID=A0A9P6HRI1_9AGAM|nr:hypothetical protein BJ322DRAFT_1034560 [Thelephora terrestris]